MDRKQNNSVQFLLKLYTLAFEKYNSSAWLFKLGKATYTFPKTNFKKKKNQFSQKAVYRTGEEERYNGRIRALMLNVYTSKTSTSQSNFKKCLTVGQDIGT